MLWESAGATRAGSSSYVARGLDVAKDRELAGPCKPERGSRKGESVEGPQLLFGDHGTQVAYEKIPVDPTECNSRGKCSVDSRTGRQENGSAARLSPPMRVGGLA